MQCAFTTHTFSTTEASASATLHISHFTQAPTPWLAAASLSTGTRCMDRLLRVGLGSSNQTYTQEGIEASCNLQSEHQQNGAHQQFM